MLAYIDPGAGSMLFQVLVAGLLGAMMAVRTIRERILGLFRQRRARSGEAHGTGTSTAASQPRDAVADPQVDSVASRPPS
ncbi:MAG TPA: hypothetical protein VFD43_05925 [Planctomycetota bacterium]|nr:hypothetical protein [Planctomycetota bacterium]